MERRLAAILAADVAGYSRMMEVDEAGTLARLKAHLGKVVEPKITAHHGNIVKTTGDGLLAEFPSVVAAVECAVEIQRSMAERNTGEAEDQRTRFRIGINIGDIILEGGDIFGDGVNIAARLEGLADPGGICVHRDVRSQVRNRLPVHFEDMGEVEVKNIARPLRVYKILLDGTAPTTVPSKQPPRWRPSKLQVAVGALALILIFTGISVLWSNGNSRRGSEAPRPVASVPTDKPSIAVLPFANISADPEQQYFADGLTEDLTTRLSGVSGLFVIARNSVMGYAGKAPKPQDVGRDLGVRYILDGSVRKSGDRLRISANLVEADNASQVWAEQYDRQLTDIFALQDEVIGDIVSALAVKLTDVEEKEIARAPTANLEAYDYYLRAETEGYYKLDFGTFGRAFNFYSKAIELDPKFADAYAGYARAAVEIWRNNFDQVMPGPVARKRAYDAAGRALELDPNNARAYTVLAILQLNDGRHEEAVQSANRAVKLKPNDAEAHANLGLILSFAGETNAAIEATEQALLLNPSAPHGLRVLAGTVFFNARLYDRAIAELEPVAKDWADTENVHEYLAAAYAMAGRTDDARKEIDALPDWPGLNLTEFQRFFGGLYKRSEDLKHFLDACRLAGLPQWPFGFVGRPEDRVVGPELEALGRGRMWTGQTVATPSVDQPFVMQIDDRNRVAFRGANTILTGESRVENDNICVRYNGYLKGDWLCGDVFRNPTAGKDGARHPEDFVHVLSDTLRYFSVDPR